MGNRTKKSFSSRNKRHAKNALSGRRRRGRLRASARRALGRGRSRTPKTSLFR